MPDALTTNAPTLADLAVEINAAFGQADSSRLHAGRLLLQAQEIFKAGKARGDSWRAWCATNIPDRSYRDIGRVMKLARSADPIAALAEERKKARLGMAKKRAREAERTNVSPPAPQIALGKQMVDVSGWGDAAKAQIMAALAAPDTDSAASNSEAAPPGHRPAEREAEARYWLLPPKLRARIDAEHDFPADVSPHARPPGFDALSPDIDWPDNALCHPLFVGFDSYDAKHGSSALVARAIEENQLYGKQIVLVLSVPDPLNLLLQAGAEVHPIPADGDEVYPAGRVRWLDTVTGEPMPSPGAAAIFVLPGRGEHADQSAREAVGSGNGTVVEHDGELTTAQIPAEHRAAAPCDDGHIIPGAVLPADAEARVAVPTLPVVDDGPSTPAAAGPARDCNAGAAPASDDERTVATAESAADDDEPSVTIAAPPVDGGAAAAEPASPSRKHSTRAGLLKRDQAPTRKNAPNHAPTPPGSGRAKNKGLDCALKGIIGCQHPARCQDEGKCLEGMSNLDDLPCAADATDVVTV